MKAQKVNLVYKFESVDSETGIDVFQAGPLLTSFGELIKEANRLVGSHPGDIGVNIKPAEKGSFIQEFIVYAPSLFQEMAKLLDQQSVQDLKNILEWVGLIGGGGTSVLGLIHFLKGKWSNIEEAGPDEYKYFTEDGQTMTVNSKIHTLVQSQKIQAGMKQVFYSTPKAVSPNSPVISTYDPSDIEGSKVVFDEEAIESIGTYSEQELSDLGKEINEFTTTIFLKPKQGSYKGDKGPYSFYNGPNIISPVYIEDPVFLADLASGKIRLYKDDVLKAVLVTQQKVDIRNDIYTHHIIKKVEDYIQTERSIQAGLFGDIKT